MSPVPFSERKVPPRTTGRQLAALSTVTASAHTSGAPRDHAATLAEAGKLAGRLQSRAGGAAAAGA